MDYPFLYLNLMLRLLVFSCLVLASLECEVEIRKPYHPMYVQTGMPMKLVCTANRCNTEKQRIRLQWDRQTHQSKWTKGGIDPKTDAGWITRDLYEEPSGFVESTLIRSIMTLDDRGWYYCRDENGDNSYSIWVTALQVESTPNMTLEGDEEDLRLNCIISGLNTNLPYIEYVWYWNNYELMNVTNRFIIPLPDNGNSTLIVQNPKKRDGGLYKCAFFFRTNLGPVNFSQPIYVDASKLIVSGTPSLHTMGSMGTFLALFFSTVLLYTT